MRATIGSAMRFRDLLVVHVRYVLLHFFLAVGAFCFLMCLCSVLEIYGKMTGIIIACLFLTGPLISKKEEIFFISRERIFGSRREYHLIISFVTVVLALGFIMVWLVWCDFVGSLLTRKVFTDAGEDFEQIVSFSLMIAVPVVTLRYIFFLVECANTCPSVSNVDTDQK